MDVGVSNWVNFFKYSVSLCNYITDGQLIFKRLGFIENIIIELIFYFKNLIIMRAILFFFISYYVHKKWSMKI